MKLAIDRLLRAQWQYQPGATHDPSPPINIEDPPAAGVTGSLAASETGSDTFAGSGAVAVIGSLAATEVGADTFAASGDVLVTGSLAATEAGADTFAGAGAVAVAGSLAATETGPDVFAAVGSVGDGSSVSGVLDASEAGSDTFAASGSVADEAAEGRPALWWRNWQPNRYSRRASPAEARKPKKRRKVTAAATEEAIEVIKADHVGAWAMVVDTGVKDRLPKTVLVPKTSENTDAELARAIANWLIAEAQREEDDIEMLLLAA